MNKETNGEGRTRWARAQDDLFNRHGVKVDARGPGHEALEAILAVLDQRAAKAKAAVPQELDIDDSGDGATAQTLGRIIDAIDLASDQDGITWVTSGPDKRRVAAIVPVDVAERDIAEYR